MWLFKQVALVERQSNTAICRDPTTCEAYRAHVAFRQSARRWIFSGHQRFGELRHRISPELLLV